MDLPVADSSFGQGGSQKFFRDFADVAKQSQVSEVNYVILARVQGLP